jgi:hypothetical protein
MRVMKQALAAAGNLAEASIRAAAAAATFGGEFEQRASNGHWVLMQRW